MQSVHADPFTLITKVLFLSTYGGIMPGGIELQLWRMKRPGQGVGDSGIKSSSQQTGITPPFIQSQNLSIEPPHNTFTQLASLRTSRPVQLNSYGLPLPSMLSLPYNDLASTHGFHAVFSITYISYHPTADISSIFLRLVAFLFAIRPHSFCLLAF